MYLQCTRLNWHGLKIFDLKNPRFIKRLKVIKIWYIRDRPFNLKGGMVFCFVQNFFFGQHKSWKRIFFLEFNIRLYDKISESDYFFFPPPKSEYFFQQHWESEYFFRKKT